MAYPISGRLIKFKYSQKGGLWDFHVAHLAHFLLSFFLFFEQLALTGNIAAVAFGGDVFSQRRYGFAGNNIASDGALNRDFKKLSWYFVPQFIAGMPGPGD